MAQTTKPIEDELLPQRLNDASIAGPKRSWCAAWSSKLRRMPRPWWDGPWLREQWPTATRFAWLRERPDVRARITHELTGLAPMAARGADVEFQADLVERVVNAGDVSLQAWEDSFLPMDLAVHGPTHTMWSTFRGSLPWTKPEAADRDMLVWLLTRLLEQDADGSSIMTPLYVRSAIDVRVWQEHIPIDLRVQVDGRRLRKELEGKSFTCRDELAVVKLERVVQHIPLEHICGVFDALERVLPGLVEAVDPDDDGESTETAQRSRSRSRAHA